MNDSFLKYNNAENFRKEAIAKNPEFYRLFTEELGFEFCETRYDEYEGYDFRLLVSFKQENSP